MTTCNLRWRSDCTLHLGLNAFSNGSRELLMGLENIPAGKSNECMPLQADFSWQGRPV